jgi:hypothetical protein
MDVPQLRSLRDGLLAPILSRLLAATMYWSSTVATPGNST